MGLEMENPQAFLTEARQALGAYEETAGALSAARDEEQRLKKALEQSRREMSEKIEKTIRAREQELNQSYDKQLNQVNSRLKKAQSQRDKAKSQGVKGRISRETEPYRMENREMKRQLRAVLEKDHVPAFCGSGLYFSLYMPRRPGELLILLLAFLLLFGALPVGIYLLIAKHSMLLLCVIYILDILLIGGLYVVVGNHTGGKHREALRQARDIRSQMLKNRRKIRSVTREIRRDSNEAGYNLEEFDDEITRVQQDRNEIIAKKQSAQNTFETVTRNILSDEIENAARPAQEALSGQLSETVKKRAALETEEKNQSLALSEKYEQYLGRKHMNEADITKLGELLEKGEAVSIIDAVTKLEMPEKET